MLLCLSWCWKHHLLSSINHRIYSHSLNFLLCLCKTNNLNRNLSWRMECCILNFVVIHVQCVGLSEQFKQNHDAKCRFYCQTKTAFSYLSREWSISMNHYTEHLGERKRMESLRWILLFKRLPKQVGILKVV